MSGTRIIGGRFSLIALSGQGAGGSVHRALDNDTGAYVAVKLLHTTADERALARFEREANLLSTIRALHLTGYVAHGQDVSGEPYLAVDWVEGEDLARTMRRRRILFGETLDIVRQALDGLAALHDHGVVHRDMKPGNLMLSTRPDGSTHVTVIDLGVAHVSGDMSLTQEGTMVGTPHFMSPEQILGQEDVTPAADVFSMGVLLFEMLTGTRAYAGNDVVEIVAKIALSDPPRLADYAPHLPASVVELVDRSLRRAPRERFQSAREMELALSVVAAEEALLRRSSESVAPAFSTGETEADETVVGATPVVDPSTVIAEPEPLLGGGEQRVVTALFAHLPGVGASHASFEEAVRAQGGRAHRLLAVAHVAVFGAERSHGDEADRAARAALQLAAELGPIRVAISTGRALTGGGDVSGDAIERGARVLEHLRDGQIGVDVNSARLLEDRFELRGEEERTLVRERAEATARVRAPIVGRVQESTELGGQLLRALTRGPAATVTLRGPGGIGKSRLAAEAVSVVLHRVSQSGDHVSVFRARPSSMSRSSAFATLRALVTPPGKLGARASLLSPLPPLLAELARLGDHELAYQHDPVLALDRLLDLLETWALAVAESGPMIFWIDDLHFADEPSQSLLAALVRNMPELRLVVLGVGREGLETSAIHRSARAPIELGPLDDASARALAVRSLVDPAVDVEQIVERASGIPYVIEELCRFAAPDGPRASLPESVLVLLQARFDALDPSARRFAAFASVFGRAFAAEGLAHVLGESAARSEAALQSLERAAIVERAESENVDLTEFSFVSELLREAAYESLVDGDRREAHRRAAFWLEVKALAEPVVLARHLELAGLTARAATYYARAAELALFGNDFAAAVHCATASLECGAELEDRGRLLLVLAEACRWRGELVRARDAATHATSVLASGSREWFFAMRERIAAHGRLGDLAAIQPLIGELFEASVEPGAESAQVAALVPAIIHLLYGGELTAARDLARRLDSDRVDPDSLLPFARARIHQLRAALHQHEGDLADAVHHQELARAEFNEARDHRAFALVTSNLAFTLLVLGQNERSEQLLSEALRLAQRLSLATVEPLALQNLGNVRARLGSHEEAVALQERALAAFDARKDPRLAAVSSVHLAIIHCDVGRLDASEHFAERVVVGAFEPFRFAGHAARARVLLARGRATEALDEARRANALLDALESVEEFEVFTRLALVEALAATGDDEGSRAALTSVASRIEGWATRISDPALRRSFWGAVPEHARVQELVAALHA